MLIIAVLETLRKYTDVQHRLMQAPLLQLLEKDYGLKVDRKSLRHNIEILVNAGYPLVYRRGWYYRHEFSRDDLLTLAGTAARDMSVSPEKSSQLFRKLNAILPCCQPRLFTAESDAKDEQSFRMYLLKQAVDSGVHVVLELEEGTVSALPTKLEAGADGPVLTAVIAGASRAVPLSDIQSVTPEEGA